jgi:hypothetical protein
VVYGAIVWCMVVYVTVYNCDSLNLRQHLVLVTLGSFQHLRQYVILGLV